MDGNVNGQLLPFITAAAGPELNKNRERMHQKSSFRKPSGGEFEDFVRRLCRSRGGYRNRRNIRHVCTAVSRINGEKISHIYNIEKTFVYYTRKMLNFLLCFMLPDGRPKHKMVSAKSPAKVMRYTLIKNRIFFMKVLSTTNRFVMFNVGSTYRRN